MGMRNIRLSSTLAFDEQQEADIVKLIDDFNSSHKMGEFLSNLIRVAVENPELIDVKDGKYETGAIIKVMEKLGKSPTRHNYMLGVNKQLTEMQAKVDQMYEMCLKMYTMVEMGKRLGIEKKTENMILAQFSVEQQLEQLKRAIGTEIINTPFAANRVTSVESRAASTLDYIISAYEPIINALKNELEVKPIEIPLSNVAYVPQISAPIEQVQTIVQPVVQSVEQKNNQTLNIKPVELLVDNAEDESTDFNGADFGALGTFFGDD